MKDKRRRVTIMKRHNRPAVIKYVSVHLSSWELEVDHLQLALTNYVNMHALYYRYQHLECTSSCEHVALR